MEGGGKWVAHGVAGVPSQKINTLKWWAVFSFINAAKSMANITSQTYGDFQLYFHIGLHDDPTLPPKMDNLFIRLKWAITISKSLGMCRYDYLQTGLW